MLPFLILLLKSGGHRPKHVASPCFYPVSPSFQLPDIVFMFCFLPYSIILVFAFFLSSCYCFAISFFYVTAC